MSAVSAPSTDLVVRGDALHLLALGAGGERGRGLPGPAVLGRACSFRARPAAAAAHGKRARAAGPSVYDDRWPSLETYLEWLAARLEVARDALAPHGTLVAAPRSARGARGEGRAGCASSAARPGLRRRDHLASGKRDQDAPRSRGEPPDDPRLRALARFSVEQRGPGACARPMRRPARRCTSPAPTSDGRAYRERVIGARSVPLLRRRGARARQRVGGLSEHGGQHPAAEGDDRLPDPEATQAARSHRARRQRGRWPRDRSVPRLGDHAGGGGGARSPLRRAGHRRRGTPDRLRAARERADRVLGGRRERHRDHACPRREPRAPARWRRGGALPLVRGRGGRGHLASRRVRQRQDHPAARARHPGAAPPGHGRDHLSRRGGHRDSRAHGLPPTGGLRGAGRADARRHGGRQPARRAAARRARPARRARLAQLLRAVDIGAVVPARARRSRSRAARSSGSPSPARWRTSRRRSCSTSRPRRSTPKPPSTCW